MHQTEVSKDVTRKGVTLRITAREHCKGEWVLSIRNPLGVSTVWTDFFTSARSALDAGERAIDAEGVETFTDCEGFEYLLDNPLGSPAGRRPN